MNLFKSTTDELVTAKGERDMGEISRLIKLLKTTNARVDFEDKWLYYDEDNSQWVTLQRPFGAKKNRTLYAGESLPDALAALGGKQARL